MSYLNNVNHRQTTL